MKGLPICIINYKNIHYEDAVAQFDYVIKLASDYVSGYSFRAESYIGLKQYNEAIDDIIRLWL